ncbi:hypothetical protein FB45DRAFT_1087101 [Roridomyces roridus]|uniref:Uncharacterized protein n=1 Tax=Roridomyces roridus TaxID=1738132 RepID=A0AAD7BM27_9AGAR|nr:hypothetical protein FB45DRAFT_1087101 [Roridomyces roridus]
MLALTFTFASLIAGKVHLAPNLNVTVGFALPPPGDGTFVDEVLILGSFPVPYGYAGVVLGALEVGKLGLQKRAEGTISVEWYEDFVAVEQAEATPFSIQNCRAEMTTLYVPQFSRTPRSQKVYPSSNDTPIPLRDAPINVTFSPSTTWSPSSAQFIFRCQNCGILADYLTRADEVEVTALISSSSYPEYLDNSLTLANLSLVGAQYEVLVLNAVAARFHNYSELLSAAGFF